MSATSSITDSVKEAEAETRAQWGLKANTKAVKPFKLGTILTADAKGEGVAQAEVELPKLAHSSDS